MRLDVPAGTAVRFEPGVERDVTLVPIAGRRIVPGLRPEWAGPLDAAPAATAPTATAPADAVPPDTASPGAAPLDGSPDVR
ncbi:hypothetical protein Psi01_27770 [Planobispora siamensis]|uniref:Urease subunit beta n=2 Tax=Planobispora siamensis TaxID=936338 RepID=A0A8J3WL12_9ACTN|nr:hypothetical protein Psi01_27770 [Planobispora siamensis]